MAVLFDGITLAWLADPEGTKPDELFVLIDALVGAAVGRPGDSDGLGPSVAATR